MSINIRTKGQTGEREVAQALNPIVLRLLAKHGLPLPPVDKPPVQRNQNQTAVGGADLVGTYGLAIEIKRQEALSINAWWQQCTTQARNNGEVPVLVYRQNGKKWRVVLLAALVLPDRKQKVFDEQQRCVLWQAVGSRNTIARVEIDWDTFLAWFERWVDCKLEHV